MVRSVEADVPEHTADGREIDAGGDHLYAHRVAERVRVHAFSLKRRQLLCGCSNVFRELEPDASGTERSTVTIDEHGFMVESWLALEQRRQ